LNLALGAAPGPDSPVFESFVRVRFHEVDSLGHVNNAVYLEYLEQAAVDHALAAGLDIDRLNAFGGLFVAYRHEIVYLRPAYAGDILRIVTWLDEPQGARVTRNYLVSTNRDDPRATPIVGRLARGREVPEQGNLVVQARTEWVFTNERGRPRRIPQELMRLFRDSAPPRGDQMAANT
jgi:acyl-CoA thioester hydrolase